MNTAKQIFLNEADSEYLFDHFHDFYALEEFESRILENSAPILSKLEFEECEEEKKSLSKSFSMKKKRQKFDVVGSEDVKMRLFEEESISYKRVFSNPETPTKAEANKIPETLFKAPVKNIRSLF